MSDGRQNQEGQGAREEIQEFHFPEQHFLNSFAGLMRVRAVNAIDMTTSLVMSLIFGAPARIPLRSSG
jgi:hypothetical protein